MKIVDINGQEYKLPNELNSFQREMYVHLVEWKWKHITTEPGVYRGIEYDARLPENAVGRSPLIYGAVQDAFGRHLAKYPFRIHQHFDHMASSQAANVNLFLPVLRHPNVNAIMAGVRADFSRLATEYLDEGYRIEFWDEPFGNLGDKTDVSGTDSDIAIAYYNHEGELCLWLIEHKLTEAEFTTCGGCRSQGKSSRHDCKASFAEILRNKDLCYYHDRCGYEYWKVTERHEGFFVNHAQYPHCPFQGGMNQLWRNQLLAMSVEDDDRQPYKHVSFSVVHHPGNDSLTSTLEAYADLTADNPAFSILTSADVVAAAETHCDGDLAEWVSWYKGLYNL